MLLTTCATDREAAPLRALLPRGQERQILVTGIGPVETALHLSRHLARAEGRYQGIVQFGIAGAYTGTGITVGAVCLAEEEVWGDFGICMGDAVMPLVVDGASTAVRFDLRCPLLAAARQALAAAALPFHAGSFVTVSGASGTERRGIRLRDTHHAICENMEGAAAARVALAFGLSFLEIRGVSNLVEDRDPRRWRIAEAAERCAAAVAAVLRAGDSPTSSH